MLIHNKKLFSQMDGVTMGNGLGRSLANWFLVMIGKKINFDQNLSLYPSFKVSYVDDVFAIFNSWVDIQSFSIALRGQQSDLRFTCKKAPGPSLTFRDVEAAIREGSLISVCTANQILPTYFCISTT